jgi:hypothetical protein
MKTASRGMRRTLGHLVQHQLTLWIHCLKCRRAAKLDVQRLVEVHGAEIVLKALFRSCTCETCGAHWPDIDVEVPQGRQREVSLRSA